MPEINSPLGRRALAQSSRQVFTIPDEDEPDKRLTEGSEKLKQLEEARSEKLSAKSRVSSSAKERVELLIGAGRTKVDVPIDGFIFTLNSLKSGETREVVRLSSIADKEGISNIESYLMLRAYTLAFAISEVDGQAVELVIGSSDYNDKVAWIDELNENAIVLLYDKYFEMINKNKEKYTIKDEVDAKGVAEDIKK